ncbi:MAG TPA: ABC transporter permease subunit [Micromonosporaceae bacterium]|jgi:putative spermidine/putrescine transport system permease protein
MTTLAPPQTERQVVAAAPIGRRRAGSWVALAPFFLYTAICLGLPTWALLYNSVRRTNPTTQQTSFTLANITTSWHGFYLTALWGSVKLSLITALISVIVGTIAGYAIVTSRGTTVRQIVLSLSGVLANFGGIPLAFCFIATVGTAGEVVNLMHTIAPGFALDTFAGIAVVYPYFLIPLMVLVIVPTLEGLRPQWRESARNLGASTWQFWRYVGLPVLTPSVLGGFVLTFGGAFAAYATAKALTGGTVPLITLRIASVISGNVLAGQENVGAAMSLNMIVICGLVMAVYLPLRSRSARWLNA